MHAQRETALARVVVALDGHGDDEPALAFAAATAHAHAVPLELHHCWQPARVTGPPGGTVLPAIAHHPTPTPTTKRMLRETVLRVPAPPGLPVSGHLLTGNPVTALLNELTPADLLVLTVRSRHRITARALGSTTSRLIDHTPGPLALLPPQQPTASGPFTGHVVIGVDNSPASTEAVRLGFTEAALHQAPVAVVHAYQSTSFGSVIDEDTLETRLEPFPPQYRLLQNAIQPYRHTSLPIRRACLTGTPAQALLRAAAGARLLVLGRHERTWHTTTATRLTDLILTEATCPLLLTAPVPAHGSAHVPAPRAAAAPAENSGSTS